MTFLKQLKLQSRVVALLAPLLFVGVLGVGGAILGITEIEARTEWIRAFDIQERRSLEAQIAAQRMIIADISYFLTGQPLFITEHARHAEAVDEWLDETNIAVETLTSDTFDITSTSFTYGDLEALGIEITNAESGSTVVELAERVTLLESSLEAYDTLWEEMKADIEAGNSEEAYAKLGDLVAQMDAIQTEFYILNGVFDLYAQDEKSFADAMRVLIVLGSFVVLAIFIVLLLITLRVVNKQIAQPMSTLLTVTRELRDGHYNAEELAALSERNDELGIVAKAFTRMAKETQAVEATLQAEIDDLRQKIGNLETPPQVSP